MKRLGTGCCSGCLWLFVIALLIYSWEGSSWPLRALELGTLAVVAVAAIAYQQRRSRTKTEREATPARPSAVYQPPPDGFATAAQDIAAKARAKGQG
jgi:hypothetical protein